MGAFPPTCSACGTVLSGYGRSEALNIEVYFCPQCRAKEGAGGVEVQKPAAAPEVRVKAA
jgi:hypothetical protein